jgi:hypothetical protein
MAADNVVEFETVLPNGTIANINAKNNPDVLIAMRGSGDQFGWQSIGTVDKNGANYTQASSPNLL